MIQDIRIHGEITPDLEFYATLYGPNLQYRHFYSHEVESGHTRWRFFLNENELVLDERGVQYRGTGGGVSEYMFGADQPVKDLARREVLNRLVLFGARYLTGQDRLLFTNQTAGFDSFQKIFLEGNAVANNYFLIQTGRGEETRSVQEYILRAVGKDLKRSTYVAGRNDSDLIKEVAGAFEEEDLLIFLLRLINRNTQQFYEVFSNFYQKEKELTHRQQKFLQNLAERLSIDQYQQERIKIDAIYKHPDNQKIIAQYKEVLLEPGKDYAHKKAALQRLRTFSLRNNIPLNIFDIMDQLLLKEPRAERDQGKEYIETARHLFEELFLRDDATTRAPSTSEMVHLLFAKKQAVEARDNAFEEILLETGRVCDERASETEDFTPLEHFGAIITHFDRFDACASTINHLGFVDDVELSLDKARSLQGHKRVFDDLRPGLFRDLFVTPVLENKYIITYGKRKVRDLAEGLEAVEAGKAALEDVVARIHDVNQEEKVYFITYHYTKEYIKNFYSDLSSAEEQAGFRAKLSEELIRKGRIDAEIPRSLFYDVVLNIKKEAFYLQNLLPKIIESRDLELREDFFQNSGLDRFYIEELEKEYLEHSNLNVSILEELRGT